MDLIYPINFIGHDEWLESGYDLSLAQGDVITRDGEVLGTWRVVGYDPEDDYSAGQFEFIQNGHETATLTEGFGALDMRMSRGLALSKLSKAIRDWTEELPG